MSRRSVLTLIGSGGVSIVAGCSGGGGGCPDLDLEHERSYEVRIPEGGGHNGNGIDLLKSREGMDGFVWDNLTDDDERWIAETDYDESVVIALKESAGGSNNSDFEVVGVERESNRVVHAYSCLAEIKGGDVGNLYTRLIRVSYDTQPPTEGRYTHWEEGDSTTYETTE